MGVEVAGQDNSLVLVAGQQDHQRHAVEGQRETWQAVIVSIMVHVK